MSDVLGPISREGTLKIQSVSAEWIDRCMYALNPATWPRWLCWWFGHEPTEPIFSHAVSRCRCGAVRMTDEELVRIGRPNWWTRLIQRLPARREPRWRGKIVSSYRTVEEAAELERRYGPHA